MSGSQLFWTIYERMVDEKIDTRVADLVEACFGGSALMEAVLAGEAPPSRSGRPPQNPRPKPATLVRLDVSAFRGVGPKASIEFTPGPGLTLIVGRNGSGKSSFAEALEVLLSGTIRRLDARPKDWKDGWRNLHSTHTAEIRGTFAVEGRQPVTVTRAWGAGVADLSASTTQGLDDLEWSTAVTTHRPFLPHNELGALLESGPSKAYDSLKAILGLDEIASALQVLADARLKRERAVKEVKGAVAPLLAKLAVSDDSRAADARTALGGKRWDLDAIEPLVAGPAEAAVPDALRRVAGLRAPTLDTAALRSALETQVATVGTDAARSLSLAELLDHALLWHGGVGDGPCPLCGKGTLDAEWKERLSIETSALRRSANAAADAARAVRNAAAAVRPPAPPPELKTTLDLPPDVLRAALDAWNVLADAPAEPVALATHIDLHLPEVEAAVTAVAEAARARITALEDAWRPYRIALAGWLASARDALAGEAALTRIKEAEKWLKEAETDLQKDRFLPIATRAQETWTALRQESSVELTGVTLSGSGNRRRLDLALAVEGADAPLGVISQGEMNALALSLFIPRLVHEDSPFHFLVIDDPVQSMDPYKVDGLAKVLHAAAKTRQVLVFTHDTRLVDAVNRMHLPATVLDIGRRARSAIDVRKVESPARQALSDARAVAMSADTVGQGALRRVVPGLCREAIERTLQQVARRRLLGRGDTLESVEERLGTLRTHSLAALAIYLDEGRGADVYGWLNQQGSGFADTFRELKESTHTGQVDEALVARTERLVQRLEQALR